MGLVGTFATTLVGISSAYYLGISVGDLIQNSMGTVSMAFQEINR